MRYLAVHDRRGRIVSLSAGPSEGPAMAVALEPGHQVTEVDPGESGLDLVALDSEKDAVEVMSGLEVRDARLVRREDSRGS